MKGPINCTKSELHTFLQGLAEESSQICYSGTDQSAQSKSTHSAKRSCKQGKKMDASLGFQSLMMSKNSMENPGEDWLTLLMQDFHASHIQQSENEQVQMMTKTYGQIPLESFAKWHPDSHCWKTCQGFFTLTISAKSSETWQARGTMQNGMLYQLPKWALHTKEKGCGSSPTKTIGTPTAQNRTRSEQWRTGASTLAEIIADILNHGGVMMPKIPSEKIAYQSSTQIQPTKLNPEFSCWLMGWPTTWTNLQPLGMDKFQLWLRQHFLYLPNALGYCRKRRWIR